MRKFAKNLIKLIESTGFYRFVIIFFIFQSAWIALSAVYPEAFDENFHYGLIKLYSHYWLPFLKSQPAGADQYGAVARDPSFFYHYLMSFPYRFLHLFTNNQPFLIISLRMLDVAFFAIGLIIFKKVMLRAKISKALANISLLIFILIPIVPQLAGQVNYDDLLFLMTALCCYKAFDLIDEIRSKKVQAKTVLVLAILIVMSTIVKYAFLPIALAICLFILYELYKVYKGKLQALLHQFWSSLKKMSFVSKFILVALLVLFLGMFAERDGYNLVKYHDVVPNCSKVLSVARCNKYSPWWADNLRHNQLLAGTATNNDNIIQYAGEWLYWMWYRLFFAINGNFSNNPPLLLPSIAAVILALAAAYCIIKWRKKIFTSPYVLMLITIAGIYCVALFIKAYASYKYTGTLENMNGRYLLPILLPVAAVVGLAFSNAFRKSVHKKVIATLVVVVLFLEGGGLASFIINSNDTWYWDNSAVKQVNSTAKKVVKPIVIKKHVAEP